ncbi:hypothetical protein PUNSTDRAFT_141980 [Punctularia strigosozonata HHB-11173 SS5]|uniref:uncharacterized protein n=1 Tax=Punctularia strigosozonata (strain HHB-11173) TaxID=741275 RepID=UPI0004416277|nr:uncharacterized protein PUNSTDRAFT_141980 [Punctularia strigosozonata HHB-11173 SS5]EIN11705.1 hypothetical protein PUNSTDRAFT_141980 [Punctularia strigosozonata HHB-11173 SS5]
MSSFPSNVPGLGTEQSHRPSWTALPPAYLVSADGSPEKLGALETSTPALPAQVEQTAFDDKPRRSCDIPDWCLNPKFLGFVSILFLALIVCLGVFLIPRKPALSFNPPPITLITDAVVPSPRFSAPSSSSRASFSFLADVNLHIDVHKNYIPTKIMKGANLTMTDLETKAKVGTAKMASVKIKPHGHADLQVPMNFTYVAKKNGDDPTWTKWHDACQGSANVTRPALDIQLHASMKISLHHGPIKVSATLRGVFCPLELPSGF